MVILIFLSIIVELYFVHKNINLYRDKKINLKVFLLFIVLISALIIRNFVSMHYYLNSQSEISSWYGEIVSFIVSVSLVALIVLMDIMHRPMLMASEETVWTFQDALESIPLKVFKNPYLVVNSEGIIAYTNEAYKALVQKSNNAEDDIHVLSDYFDVLDSLESILALDGQCVKLKSQEEGIDSLRFTCHSFDDNKHVFILLDQPIIEQKAPESNEGLKEQLNRYERLLQPGKWEMLYDTTEVLCSNRTMEIFDLKDSKCSLELIKRHIHPEDLLEFEQSLQKMPWLSGSSAIDLRFLINSEVKFVTVFYEIVKDELGVPYKVLGCVQDLSSQRHVMNQRLLQECSDAIAGVVQEISEPLYPLLDKLSDLTLDEASHKQIQESYYVLNAHKRKFISAHSQKHLINADRLIEETVSKYSYTGRVLHLTLNLNGGNSLINIDEDSFEKLFTHLIGDVPRINRRINVVVASYEKKETIKSGVRQIYGFGLKISKLELEMFEYECFKERFYRMPSGKDETMLFHAQSIIKKFRGRVLFDEDEFFYTFKIEFNAIHLDLGSEKGQLRNIGYIGQYPIYSRAIKDFFMNYSVDVAMIEVVNNINVSKYEVVVVESSVSDLIIEGLTTACRKTKFLILNTSCQIVGDNIEVIDIETTFGALISSLSEHYVMIARTNIGASNDRDVEILEQLDQGGIKATVSSKIIGRQLPLYFEYLKIFKVYYQTLFDKLEGYLKNQNQKDLMFDLKRLGEDARLLGCIDLMNYADTFLEKMSWQTGDELRRSYEEAMQPLNNALSIINATTYISTSPLNLMDEDLEIISQLLETCLEALRDKKPVHSRELIQTLLHYQSLATFEETLVEASLLAQKYNFDEAIKAVESIANMVNITEIA